MNVMCFRTAARCLRMLGLLVVLLGLESFCVGADGLPQQIQQSIQKAIAQADPSIVRIETVGGVDLVGELLTGTGPTTGVVVRGDGYVITSRFNFLANPASIVVTLPDGRRLAAEIVASDLSRMLTLLKVSADDLVPMTAVPKEDFRVGQTALALGRTFDMQFPNVSAGIVSALDRVWGRALQTDAKTSPVNYGGPLIDLTGRCLGIIVPLSPQEQGETAGVEWYDSGIGFAVPLVDVQAVLPRMIAKETLKPGLMGLGFDDHGPVSGTAQVIRVRPESPADHAEIQVDDVIEAVDGRPISKLNDLKHLVGPRYAKEVIRLAVRRGDQLLEKELTLTDHLDAYQFPYLGILPERSPGTEQPAGARVRIVFPDSPAANAGLKPGDLIQRVGAESISGAAELRQQLRRIEVGAEVKLTLVRGEKTLELKALLAAFPNEPPAAVEREVIPQPDPATDARTGRLNEQLPEDGLSFWAYVPENYRADWPWGLLIWLHPPGETEEAETLEAWSEVCRERGLILVGPRSGDVSGWAADQEAQVREVIAWVQSRYNIDASRVIVMGREGSVPFASKLAFKYRELVRGLILFSAPLRSAPPDNDPDFPLQVACISSAKGSQHRQVVAMVEGMQKLKFPTCLLEPAGKEPSPFPVDVVNRLAVWLDALDRI